MDYVSTSQIYNLDMIANNTYIFSISQWIKKSDSCTKICTVSTDSLEPK